MPTVTVSFECTPEEAEPLCSALEAAFEEDGYPVDQLWLDEGARRRVEVLFWDLTIAEAEQSVHRAIGSDLLPKMTVAQLGDEDWVAKSLEGLTPVHAARLIVHGRHDRDAIPVGRIGLEIEAAQAFGTGHHGTTVGCLLELQRLLLAGRPKRLLDLGTGTGVLAIALAKLTHTLVVGTDIDPIATLAAQENAKKNSVGPLTRFITTAGARSHMLAQHGPFDLIVANILARPLAEMAADVGRIASKRSALVLSGLRPSDRRKVCAAYRAHGFCFRRALKFDDWLTLTLVR